MFNNDDFPDPEHPSIATNWFLRNSPLILFKITFFSRIKNKCFTSLIVVEFSN